MRVFGVVIGLFGGLSLVASLFLLSSPAAGGNLPLADMPAEEADLNPDGGAYEINVDQGGDLWISDFLADEIWQVNPATGAYTVFQGMLAPSDARRDASGYVWWGGGDNNEFGRLDPATGQASWWTLPDDVTLFGTQLDANGDFWVVSTFDTKLYRFDPTAGQLCTYLIPNDGSADYPIAQDGNVWLGDWANNQLHQLDTQAGTFTSYDLPANALPEGMALDSNGHIWWADTNLAQLARFEPDIAGLTQYTLPTGLWPEMVSVRSNQIWYGEQWDGAIGVLDPATAAGATSVLTPTVSSATPSCTTISPSSNSTLSMTTGTMSWSDQNYNTIVDSGGWTVYQLPDDAFPWGVAGSPGQVWFVDTGRQILGRIPQETGTSVTGCKAEDADGNINTTDDQTPVADWSLDLRIDGVAQDLSQLTDGNGCTTWSGLDAGPAYGIVEELPAGWTALAPTNHDFAASQPGLSYQHTFINSQYASVTACKVEDADGDLETSDDRTPLENWAMDLTIGGLAQGITQTTAANGCTTWSDLDLGLTYGLVEELPAEWLALTDTSFQFAPAASGAQMSFTFINSQGVSVAACKVEDADGQLETTDDRTALQDWAIDLTIDGVAQAITQTTGLDGCTTWVGLESGPAYGLVEELPAGWTALTNTSFQFAPAAPGDKLSFTFINSGGVSVTGCKLEDADGSVATTGDRSPLKDWPLDLTIGGVAQGMSQMTGLDGCTTWSGLSPGSTYGLVESLPQDWIALTPTSHQFAPAGSGDDFSHSFVNSQLASVTACKLEDLDGDLGTAGDRTPVPDFELSLSFDSTTQKKNTGQDGCATWTGLALGEIYTVAETVPPGWSNLTATTHAFPAATSGQQLEHDFINFQNVSVSACKLHDADGSLGTSGDQTPIEGWSIYLTVDGQRQGPAKETGANGCASWQDLGPGKSYGLEEELPPEWSPLTPIKKNFGTATSGAAYSYTFINTQASIGYSIYLPLLVK